MALNLNKSEESPSNANGDALIGNSSNARALKKPEISCITSSMPDNSSAVISFTGKLPHICYHQVTSRYEVIDLDDTSSEDEETEDEETEDEEPEDEEPDLDLGLRLGQGDVINVEGEEDVKEFSSSSVSSTYGQIQGFSHRENEEILILLGCVICHLYVMVSKDDPTCPMCRKKNSFIEIPSGKPFKKQKLE